MSFSRHTSRIYMDDFDIGGALKVLKDETESEGFPTELTDFYIGAHITLSLIREHEDIRDQSVFMQLFKNKVTQCEYGYEGYDWEVTNNG